MDDEREELEGASAYLNEKMEKEKEQENSFSLAESASPQLIERDRVQERTGE